ncbi:MAG: hypothetical protein MUF19_04530 [Candidatus Pacebacteria bacterium]|jgi:hypothetical protein|nr:hypothetical protein [Candidatus Paceibacterota bacterium]
MGKPGKKIPEWLARLREADPSAYQAACRRGGQRSAKVQRERRLRQKPLPSKPTHEELLADFEELKAMEAARYAAWQRRDHLLPPEDNDLGED